MADHPHEYQYIIKKFLLVSHTGLEIDIWRQVVQFSFEESMAGRALHGTVTMVESLDLPTLLPMIGEERLKVSFTRLDENTGAELDPVQFDLPIYTLFNKNQEGKSLKRQTYSFSFCSDSVFKNINSVVSKPFKNLAYSDMVREIYDQYLKVDDKQIEVEPTAGVMNYTVQNSRAFKAIDLICKRCKSADARNGSFYFFYEDREKFNFVSLRGLLNKGLLDKTNIRKLYYVPKNYPTSDARNDISVSMYNAEEVGGSQGGFDILKSFLTGEVSSSILLVDPIRRSFSFKTLDLRGEDAKQEIDQKVSSPAPTEFLANSDFSSISGEGSKKPWTNNSKIFVNPRANMRVMIGDSGQDEQEYITSRDPTIRPYSPEEFALQKTAEKAQFHRNVITTTIPGDPKIKLGSLVNFQIPERTGAVGENAPEELDKYMQGYYIVVGISHTITKDRYKMHLELTRSSIHSDIKPRDPFQIYVSGK